MADKKNGSLRVVSEAEKRDYKKQLREHRIKILRRTLIIAVIVLLVVAGLGIYMSLRQYSEYDVRAAVERTDTKATVFKEFKGNILKYSNDGASYTDHNNEMIWNQTYEMSHPAVDLCGDYLCLYDKKGKKIFIMNQKGLVRSIETNMPISTVSIAAQGTVAVLMENQTSGVLSLYDKEGNQLVSGAIHGEKGGFPIAIALSDDAIKLAVSMLDINSGKARSTLAFYNFGKVGENEIDHVVSAVTYDDMVIPELDFVSKDCLLAIGDTKLMVFEGTQKPSFKTEIVYKEQVNSIFYNENYYGVVYHSNDATVNKLLQVYDLTGKLCMETTLETEYTAVELLSSNEVCVRNRNACDIYTTRGVYKFHHEFDEELYAVIPGKGSLNYTFVLDGVTTQTRLK